MVLVDIHILLEKILFHVYHISYIRVKLICSFTYHQFIYKEEKSVTLF